MIVFQVYNNKPQPTIRTGIRGVPTPSDLVRHLKCARVLPFSFSEYHYQVDLTRWPDEVSVFALWDGFSFFRHEPRLLYSLKAITPPNQLDLFDVGDLPVKYIHPAEAKAAASGVARTFGL